MPRLPHKARQDDDDDDPEPRMPTERHTVEVHADWQGLPAPTHLGHLYATTTRGKQIFSFEYDDGWLAAEHSRALDPALRLGPGPQYLADDRENFGIFLDSSPD